MTICTRGFPGLRKLACVSVLVTILTNLRRALELDFLRSRRYFVASTARGRAVRAQQWKLCFRMVKTVDVSPGSHVVAGFAS